MAFDFIKAHFDEIMKDNPSIFGNDLGTYLPQSGASFCDAKSRSELQAYFTPLVPKYTGAPRVLSQVLESIDLCISARTGQESSVADFLRSN
jgi:hypothetical protein